MFGNLVPSVPDLLVRDHERFKSVYCGLCREYKHTSSFLSAYALSYDFVFLALLRYPLSGQRYSFTERRCELHPLRKRPVADRSPVLSYTIDAAEVLTCLKFEDDSRDEKGFKRLFALLAYKNRKRALGKTDKKQPQRADERKKLYLICKKELDRLAELEKSDVKSPDEAADCFGRLSGEVFSYGLGEREARVAYELGMRIGRWIYLADAYLDYESDIKKGGYNPFGEDSTDEMRLHSVRLNLPQASAALSLIDFEGYGAEKRILENIICLGTEGIIEKARKKALKEKSRLKGSLNGSL